MLRANCRHTCVNMSLSIAGRLAGYERASMKSSHQQVCKVLHVASAYGGTEGASWGIPRKPVHMGERIIMS
jgi:hypothetical protein